MTNELNQLKLLSIHMAAKKKLLIGHVKVLKRTASWHILAPQKNPTVLHDAYWWRVLHRSSGKHFGYENCMNSSVMYHVELVLDLQSQLLYLPA